MVNGNEIKALLDLYVGAGIDEFVGDEPVNQFSMPVAALLAPTAPVAATLAIPANNGAVTAPIRPTPTVTAAPASQSEAVEAARRSAAAAETLEELRRAVMEFNLCPLKKTATNTVFSDGNPKSRVMFVGEAPGVDEDRIGRPFVGVSGQLLDRMIAYIGLDRTSCYITNILFWRPPGNRKPTDSEIAVCRPFIERHIALVRPDVLVMVGGTASSALLPGNEGITRLRGRWFNLEIEGVNQPVEATAMYHPSFLLRSPERKRESWIDLLSIREKLSKS